MSSGREDEERGQQQRAQLLRRGGGALLGVTAVAVAVVAIAGAGDDDGSERSRSGGGAAIPEVVLGNLGEAAKAAGCALTSPPVEGSGHVTEKVTYKSNPPTSGSHDPVPAEDGVYTPGNEPAAEPTVHSLEHGRINIQYKPGIPARRVAQLETLAAEDAGYHVLLYRNQTKMPYELAATAWGQQLTCERFTDRAFDALRAFRKTYVDKGPEFVP